ncbi:MAG: hypothetical protein F4046_01735 [Acidimicrobiaceae bacterium]|nr:hypothetical protein [Acidimicrobiaceae bacterium]
MEWWTLGLSLGVLVAAVIAVATAGTAHACSCIERELDDYADGISVAFAGDQLGRVVHDHFEDNGAALLVRVERVYKGEAGPRIEVRIHAQGDPACGIDVGGHGTVGVVAHEWRNELSVNLCGSIVAIAEMEEVFGEGYPPDESISLPVSPNTGSDTLIVVLVAAGTLLPAAPHRRCRRTAAFHR